MLNMSSEMEHSLLMICEYMNTNKRINKILTIGNNPSQYRGQYRAKLVLNKKLNLQKSNYRLIYQNVLNLYALLISKKLMSNTIK
jgi:mRNA-degrading endonuclease RelE of RelBE toxin-antitoxin system